MSQKSSSMEHKAKLLPNVKFWWGYNSDDPHPLVVVSSSQRVNLRFALQVFQWIFPDFIRHNHMKYARRGTNFCIKFINLHKKSRQSLRQQICRKALFTSIQSDSDQNQEWLMCVGTKWSIQNRKHLIGLQWMGHILWLSIPSCHWSYTRLGTYEYSTNRQPNTPKGRIKCCSHHESESTLLAVLLRFGAF